MKSLPPIYMSFKVCLLLGFLPCRVRQWQTCIEWCVWHVGGNIWGPVYIFTAVSLYVVRNQLINKIEMMRKQVTVILSKINFFHIPVAGLGDTRSQFLNLKILIPAISRSYADLYASNKKIGLNIRMTNFIVVSFQHFSSSTTVSPRK